MDTVKPTVSSLTINSIDASSININLSGSDSTSGIKKYVVYYGTTSGDTTYSKEFINSSSNLNNQIIDGLTQKTTYYFFVRIFDEAGNYLDSNIISKMTWWYLQNGSNTYDNLTGGFNIYRGRTTSYDSEDANDNLAFNVSLRNNYAAFISNNTIDLTNIKTLKISYLYNHNYSNDLTVTYKAGITNVKSADDSNWLTVSSKTSIVTSSESYNGTIDIDVNSINSGYLKVYGYHGSEAQWHTCWFYTFSIIAIPK